MLKPTLIAWLPLGLSAQTLNVPYAPSRPVINGVMDEIIWTAAEWQPIDHWIAGRRPSADDFSGRFKVVWDAAHLYLAAEITDDTLYDGHPDPLDSYWDDDALEVFIDEDRSGGLHLFNHNAFAYHVALDNQSVDLVAGANGDDGHPAIMPHIESRWQRHPEKPSVIVWELAIEIHDDTYVDSASHGGTKSPSLVTLSADKEMGFMVAYCDNDGSETREHFMGSHTIEPIAGDRNRGYIDADTFGRLRLIAPKLSDN